MRSTVPGGKAGGCMISVYQYKLQENKTFSIFWICRMSCFLFAIKADNNRECGIKQAETAEKGRPLIGE